MHRRSSSAPPPGFFRGAGYVFAGAGFVVRTQVLWGFAMVPAVLTGIVLAVAGSTVIDAIVSAAPSAMRASDRSELVLHWLKSELTIASVPPVIAGLLVTAAVVQPVSAIALDIVTREQAWRAARRTWTADTASDVPFRSLETTICALAAALPILILLSIFAFRYPRVSYLATAVSFVLCGLSLTWNFVEYPLSIRDMSFTQRLKWMRTHLGAVLGFGLTCTALMLVPPFTLLVVPAGIAGATRLVIDCDRADRRRTSRVRASLREGRSLV